MAIHKAKVIGVARINGVAAPGVVELDDAVVNVQALVDGEHIEILPEPEPDPEPKPVKAPAKKKGDL